ncbi:hypothetical protein KVF96_11645 [Streptococcus equi subsp. zooepidemicus]|nr:hypothetical protein [Streptococcus equi subsp. zooepidemicus]
MKKKAYMTLILLIGILAIFLVGKQVIKKENPNKPTVDLTVYTISSSDTQKWNKVRQLETERSHIPNKGKRSSIFRRNIFKHHCRRSCYGFWS